jgi:hypothetical protein
LKYAKRNEGIWSISTIDTLIDVSDVSYRKFAVSIATDKEGNIHVLYVYNIDSFDGKVKYAVLSDDGNWKIDTIDEIDYNQYSYATKVLIAEDETVHLLYSGRYLFHAIQEETSWNITKVLASYQSGKLSIYKWRATEKHNVLYVSHGRYAATLLDIMIREGNKWITRTFHPSENPTSDTPIAVDSEGNIHVVGNGTTVKGMAHVTIFPDLNVEVEIIDKITNSSGKSVDMMMDDFDTMHIAFGVWDHGYKGTNLGIWYYRVYKDGNKKRYTIEEGEYTTNSIAMDSVGNLHISYYDDVRGNLKYASVKYNDSLPPSPPVLNLQTDGITATVSWTQVSNATGYTLFYAPYPNVEYINQIDMGNQTHFSAELWNGAAFYVAIKASNGKGASDYSNIESFVIP